MVLSGHEWLCVVMGYNGWLRVVKSGYLEPAKTGLLWLLEPLEDPKGQIILKLNTLKLLEPVKSL